jgi:hypothetical protein
LLEAHVRFRTQQSQFASRERFPRIWAGAKIFELAPKYDLAPITGAAELAALTSKFDWQNRVWFCGTLLNVRTLWPQGQIDKSTSLSHFKRHLTLIESVCGLGTEI